MTISTDNYTIGGGALYFAADAIGTALLGSTPGIQSNTYSMGNVLDTELNVDITYIDHFISTKGKRVKDKTVANTTSVMLNFAFDEMNATNMKRFFLGTDGAANEIKVVQNTTSEGCAVLVVETDIGQDFKYYIPKCTLKPDGALGLNEEDWHSAPMVLEVLQYIDNDGSQATALEWDYSATTWDTIWNAAPFGIINTTSI